MKKRQEALQKQSRNLLIQQLKAQRVKIQLFVDEVFYQIISIL